MLFFKMYDPKQKKIHYCGHSYVPVTSKLSDIIPLLNDRAGFAPDTELLLYEEIRPNMIEKINNFNEPIEKVSVLCRVFFLWQFCNFFWLVSDIGRINGRRYYYFRKGRR